MKTFQVGLNKKQAKQIVDFAHEHSESKYFFAKDGGAYFGITTGSTSEGNFKNCIVYMRGCNPDKDADWWETTSRRFGGDDFGEHFDIELLEKFVKSSYKRIVFHFNKSSISVSFKA